MTRPGGRLVAVTNGQHHLQELREIAGHAAWARTFTRENGADAIGRHFARVERRDADGWITIDDDETVRRLHRLARRRRARRSRPVRAPAAEPAGDIDLRRHTMIRVAELIERKRNGEAHSDEELTELMLGYASGEIPDYQLAAWCMAVYFRGLTARRRTRSPTR